MKRPILVSLICLLASGCGHKFYDEKLHQAQAKPTVRLTLLPQEPIAAGKTITVLAKLNDIARQHVLTDGDLQVEHTQTLHLLVIDPTLSDYQHIHPQPTATPGIYSFSFTPKLAGGYRAWADITPKATSKQEFAMADLGNPHGGGIDKTPNNESAVGAYRFALSFDTPPTADGESMGTIRITDASGSPVTSLEPVMGAYAHIVGFYDDFRTVVHIHSMGDEPKNASDRGGPELMFHLEPHKAGFIKLFAQVKIGGKDYVAPFGVMVK